MEKGANVINLDQENRGIGRKEDGNRNQQRKGDSNRHLLLNREVRLNELMKLIQDDEIVVVLRQRAYSCEERGCGPKEYIRTEEFYNGTVLDYWKSGHDEEILAERTMLKVLNIETAEDPDTVGNVIEITVY